MPVIGEGNYGCVFKPHVKCYNASPTIKNSVGKIFPDKQDFEEEKKKHMMLQRRVDPRHEFLVPIYKTCYVEDFVASDQVANCGILSSSARRHLRKPLPQIIYKYAGIDLSKLMSIKIPRQDLFKTMFNKMKQILIGLKKIHDHGYIHQDMKPSNLMWDARSQKIYIIDFGILVEKTRVFDNVNKFVLTYDYPYYPPEFKLLIYHKTFQQFYRKFMTNFHFDIRVAGKSVDIIAIMKEHFQVPIEDDLRAAFEHQTYDPSKVDLYALGVVVLLLYVWAGLHKTKKPRYPRVAEFIKGLMHFDARQRFSFHEAIQAHEAVHF